MKRFLSAHIMCIGVILDNLSSKQIDDIKGFVNRYGDDRKKICISEARFIGNDRTPLFGCDVLTLDKGTLMLAVDFRTYTRKECRSLYEVYMSELQKFLEPYGLLELYVPYKAEGDCVRKKQ